MLMMLMSILKIAKYLLRKILPQPGFEPGISLLARMFFRAFQAFFLFKCLVTKYNQIFLYVHSLSKNFSYWPGDFLNLIFFY